MIYVVKIYIKHKVYHYAYFDHPPSVEEVIKTLLVEKKTRGMQDYEVEWNATRAIGAMRRVDLQKWDDAVKDTEFTNCDWMSSFLVQRAIKVPYNGGILIYIQKMQPFSTDDHRYTLLK
jgi:hypothetical protein